MGTYSKGELKFVSMVLGEQSVMSIGQTVKQPLCALNLDTPNMVYNTSHAIRYDFFLVVLCRCNGYETPLHKL